MEGMDSTIGPVVRSVLVVVALQACGTAPTAVHSSPSPAAAMQPSVPATVSPTATAPTQPSALATVAAGPPNGRRGGAADFDWENITVPGDACLSRSAIKLVNGVALIPDEQRGHPVGGSGPKYDHLSELGQPTVGDFEEIGRAHV